MTPDQWRRVTEVFAGARPLPPEQRAEWLRAACGDDPVVHGEVCALLAADRDDDFLERGAAVQPVDLLDAAGGHELTAGETLGPYRIERLLARGGMGVLYVADDPRLRRRVTLKVLPASAARDARARARLQREARTAALLRHPHIVSIHALEECGQQLVLVAEYVEGPTLADLVAQEGPLSRARWLAAARPLADALRAAHAAHVIHRDVKTSNIVMGRDGLRLVDFGIALGEDEGEEGRITRAGLQPGTPLALAPEQLEGRAATELSDQFAFGIVLYELASGRHPFGSGPVAQVWARTLRDAPTPLSAVAPQLTPDEVALVHRCLARAPGDRFASMRDVVDLLDAGGRTASPRPPGTRPPGDAAGPAMAGIGARAGRWWDIHQAATAAMYLGMLWPGWLVADALPATWRAAAQLSLVSLAACATSLRLHLWFSARHYPRPVAARRGGLWPALIGVDIAYATLLAAMAIRTADTRVIPAVVTAGLAVCLLMASLLIEPATRRASLTTGE